MWVLTKLPFGEVVQELLHHPIQDAQSHLVGAISQFSIVHLQAEVEMRVQVLHTLSVSHGKGCSLTHHQVHHDAVRFKTVSALWGVCWEGRFIHHEELGISVGHSSTTQLHSNQLVYSTGYSLGTALTSKHDVEQGDPI